MPPKEKEPVYLCKGRDSTILQEYIDDPTKARKLFAKALQNDGFLNSFNGAIGASECTFSYPGSPWYSVYLTDADGNTYFDAPTGRAAKYYFKLNVSPDKKDAFTTEGTTDITRTDLEGKTACAINANGNCAIADLKVKGESKPRKTTERKKKEETGESEPSASVSPEVLARLEGLSLNPDESKAEAPRQYFEQIKNKMTIIEWMISKMREEDLINCIKRGSLSPDEIRRAEETISGTPASTYQEPSGPSTSKDAEAVAAEIASTMPAAEVKKMFLRISKEDLVRDLKENFPYDRKQAIMNLCARAGKKLVIKDTKRGPKLFDYDPKTGGPGEQIDENDALNECAAFEAERIRQRLMNRWTNVMRNAKTAMIKGKMPAFRTEQPPEVVERVSLTPESIMAEINSIDDPVERKRAIIALVTPFGFTTAPSKRGVMGVMILDADGEQVSDDIALEEGAALKAATVNSVSFGRYRRSRLHFGKKTVKRSKKTVKRSKKVSDGPRKKYTTAGGRKSPGVSATKYPIGTKKTGLDGNVWVIKKASNGVKRWSKK
jgi:hypothetical protein